MTWHFIGISAGGGICYVIASALVVTAFQRGSPAQVSSMQYSQLLWGILIGFRLWYEVPTLRMLLGSAFITVAGLWLLLNRQ